MSDEGDEKSVTVKAEPVTMEFTPNTAKVTLGFSAESIEERIENEEYGLAIVLCSTKLESVLSVAIRNHYNWDKDTFQNQGYHNKSLGSYLEECYTYGVLPEYERKLKDFENNHIVTVRNKFVHNHGYLEELEGDKDKQEEVVEIIEEVIDFIDDVEI